MESIFRILNANKSDFCKVSVAILVLIELFYRNKEVEPLKISEEPSS